MKPATTMLFGGVIVTGTLLFSSAANAICRGPSDLAPATTGSTATSARQMPLENTADLARGGDSSCCCTLFFVQCIMHSANGSLVGDDGHRHAGDPVSLPFGFMSMGSEVRPR